MDEGQRNNWIIMGYPYACPAPVPLAKSLAHISVGYLWKWNIFIMGRKGKFLFTCRMFHFKTKRKRFESLKTVSHPLDLPFPFVFYWILSAINVKHFIRLDKDDKGIVCFLYFFVFVNWMCCLFRFFYFGTITTQNDSVCLK